MIGDNVDRRPCALSEDAGIKYFCLFHALLHISIMQIRCGLRRQDQNIFVLGKVHNNNINGIFCRETLKLLISLVMTVTMIIHDTIILILSHYALSVELFTRSPGQLLDNFTGQRVSVRHEDLGGLEVELLGRVLGPVRPVDSLPGRHLDPVCAGARPRTAEVEVARVAAWEGLPRRPR